MNEAILRSILAVALCATAGTMVAVQPAWFWRLAVRHRGLNGVDSPQRAADLRLLRDDRAAFNRRFGVLALIMRFMASVWYVGALLFLLNLVMLLF